MGYDTTRRTHTTPYPEHAAERLIRLVNEHLTKDIRTIALRADEQEILVDGQANALWNEKTIQLETPAKDLEETVYEAFNAIPAHAIDKSFVRVTASNQKDKFDIDIATKEQPQLQPKLFPSLAELRQRAKEKENTKREHDPTQRRKRMPIDICIDENQIDNDFDINL